MNAPLAAPSRRALFAPADREDSGGGHVIRCLSLAGALQQRGLECVFAVGGLGRAILRRWAPEVAAIERGTLESVVKDGGFDLVVLDDYSVDAILELRLAPHVAVLAAIDDLANRPHTADVLIDPSFGREARDYDALAPREALRLIGPDYALLRPAFAALRSAPSRRTRASRPRRLFASFGLSDVNEAARRVVSLARRAAPDLAVDLALSSSAPSLAPLEALGDTRLRIHPDAVDVAGLMNQADIGIGAGGVAAWERACLGLPSILVTLADNQRAMAERLRAAGASLVIDLEDPHFETGFSAALTSLLDPDVRLRLSNTSQSLCDGLGSERAADVLLGLIARGRSEPRP